ncbi:hypothetical protein KABACHOK_00570 [Brevundimonas phage vB_BpoS-Kabachok]|uniref:Phosphohydrolase n=2 Tax=Marchewkavirus TaxID=3425052 RepID=A0A9E7MNW5_9CAUD|nr:hypothetical protein KABACHOK_00570 [Brevundimonas phage vB_BpoS-Kabachok]USN14590.1 putative phosphohydrolase [Brevundimonas phage vB_BpoS-Domovoi]
MNLTQLELLRLYDEPHRRYHSVFHVLEMLEMHDSGATRGLRVLGYRKPYFPAYLEVIFRTAVAAHDCVYQIGREKGWNERQSLEAWRAKGLFVRPEIAEALILVTINHNPDEFPHDDPSVRHMIRHMVDLDMAPLAADPDEYDRNSENLKLEFLSGGLDPDAYEKGRRAFLQHTLEQPSIFFTEQFKPLEVQARQNMRRALEPGYGV